MPLPLDELWGVLRRRPVILLESARASNVRVCSYLFVNPLTTITAERLDEVIPSLERLSVVARTHWVAGYVTYEAGYALEPRLRSLFHHRRLPKPLVWFGVYRQPWIFDHAAGRWTVGGSPTERHGCFREQTGHTGFVRLGLSPASYRRALGRIKAFIAAGDTYQVNFTFNTFLHTTEPPLALYRRLRRAQPVPYAAFIDTGRVRILSFSPELFFERRGCRIVTRPMKGTAPRGVTPEEDIGVCMRLAHDPKNRAENVMIVDLLRNDLGRICRAGSVKAGPLFSVETHPTLHQMTSTVRGRLKRNVALSDIFRVLFPCGSVTGAPKIRTMQIIAELERGARGVYCGAIGFASPQDRAVFSVAIRTLEQIRKSGIWRYRVGSGIVWDSQIREEWEECRLKAAFLTRRPPSYRLVETILWRARGPLYLREHLRRLRRSATMLGFAVSTERLSELIRAIGQRLAGGPTQRVRILLDAEGRLEWENHALEQTVSRGEAVVYLWPEPVDPSNPLLYHKTTERPWYAKATAVYASASCFDILFTNTRGEVTEGTRTNVFARIGGILYTPPVSCGLLPGILRERLLRSGKCRERVLTPADLRCADALYCGNSVRGLVPVRLVPFPRHLVRRENSAQSAAPTSTASGS